MSKNTVRLVITMSPNGGVEVNGPIDNGILCFGLLEIAKDVVKKHIKEKNESGIVGVQLVLPGNGRRG